MEKYETELTDSAVRIVFDAKDPYPSRRAKISSTRHTSDAAPARTSRNCPSQKRDRSPVDLSLSGSSRSTG